MDKRRKRRVRKNIQHKKEVRIIGIIVGCIIPLILILFFASIQIKKIKEYDWTQIAKQLGIGKEEQQEDKLPQTKEDSMQQGDITLTEDKLLLALSYLCGEESTLNEKSAFSYIKETADAGNSDAQYFAGQMYLYGIGTDANPDYAGVYLKRAVENNNARAFAAYARLCFIGYQDAENGYTKVQDYEKARELFAAAEQSGDAQAAYALGVIYFYGMCVEPDFNLANAYFTKAVEGGCTQAQVWKDRVQTYVTQEKVSVPESSRQLPPDTIYKDDRMNQLIARYAQILEQTDNQGAFAQELQSMVQVAPEAAWYTVLYGKNDWLFYQNASDGNTYEDYIGNPEKYFSMEEKAAIKKNLEEKRDAVKAQNENARFVVLIIPNKETIYSEYMPSYIERISQKTRTDDLVEYLQANTDVEIAYAKDAMMANKEEHQLYYYTDTHCNMKGAYVALSEVMKIYDKKLTLDDSCFTTNTELYTGDLGNMLGRADRYKDDTVFNLNPSTISEEDKVEKKALLIGDSFGEFIKMQAENYFLNGLTFKFIGDFGFHYNTTMNASLDNEVVDLVIWECAERYIDRLK